jgi:hypothetical protein
MIVSLPGSLSLPYSKTISYCLSPNTYLHSCLGEFSSSLRNTCALFQSNPNLYRQKSRFFRTGVPIYRFLSYSWAREDSPFPNMYHLKSVCRLAALLWISAIYLDTPNVEQLHSELEFLHTRALKHNLDQAGTVELLWCLLSKQEDRMMPHDRSWHVVRILSAAKTLSMRTLDLTSDLIFWLLNMRDEYQRGDVALLSGHRRGERGIRDCW